MPEICRFYGIIIKMFNEEHLPPHFHAIYGEYNGIFGIHDCEMIAGDIPNRARQFIREWAAIYKNELLQMWEQKRISKLPPLD